MGMVTHAIVTDGPANSGAKRKYPLADYMQRAEERQLSVRIRPMSEASIAGSRSTRISDATSQLGLPPGDREHGAVSGYQLSMPISRPTLAVSVQGISQSGYGFLGPMARTKLFVNHDGEASVVSWTRSSCSKLSTARTQP